MEAQTFWANSMASAMKRVVAEMGANAVILSTHEAEHPDKPSTRVYSVTAAPAGAIEIDEPQVVSSRTKGAAKRDDSVVAQARMEMMDCLLEQLRDLQQELSELRSARTHWEKTAQLCSSLQDQVKDLSTRITESSMVPTFSKALRDTDRRTSSAHGVTQVTTSLPLWSRKGPGVAIISGPDGAGKTSTAAKIAAEASLVHGLSVALVESDEGGELCRLGNLIGVPTWSVPKDGSLLSVLDACGGLDLVIVDSSDIPSPELYSALQICSSDVYVEHIRVVPATWDEESLNKNFLEGGPIDSIIPTKVDEARSIKGILAAVAKSGYPISHVCIGPSVPGDIREATNEDLQSRVRAA